MSDTGKTCDYPGCTRGTPYTDWTRCEAHNGKPLPVTAETITDDQIRAVFASIPPGHHDVAAALDAVDTRCSPSERERGRARCAEILNAWSAS
jgi:hypothetical protein